MYLVGEQFPYISEVISELQLIPAQLVNGLPSEAANIYLDSVADLYTQHDPDQVFLICEGKLAGSINQREVFYMQEGDIVGLRQGFSLPKCKYSSKDPIELIPYNRKAFFEHIQADPARQTLLTKYLVGYAAVLADGLSRLTPYSDKPTTGFLQVKAGETIISEGEQADHVFILMTGRAEVYVRGVKVGNIYQDEIFGAMAMFTQEKRSATVIAKDDCTLTAVPKDQFINLIQTHPRVCLNLMENMARRINALNQKLASPGSNDSASTVGVMS
ncbi:Crp/Fnr family transcriptional regulator [Spartinivicinus poritis]|uniref:Cyclic nucleotide-binding domain-containing protein n=1 Tax=Spartinivicinus poritis TaxID=2994640 RepID=A0ABT5U9Z6_9GAMM|nr:cyclic nucleotide-binding domain-containing protein [Spartinivicinus sp. A2-2]MDE1463177.1 cyclic nucleotide-binding domain-containing protein [Spartinivicinus sp. A2-2]